MSEFHVNFEISRAVSVFCKKKNHSDAKVKSHSRNRYIKVKQKKDRYVNSECAEDHT